MTETQTVLTGKHALQPKQQQKKTGYCYHCYMKWSTPPALQQNVHSLPEFCMKSTLSFPFSLYVDRNSSVVSIKNHFIWEGKDLKTLFRFALSIGTRFHSVPNNRAQWSICKCTLSFINKSDGIRDKSTVP